MKPKRRSLILARRTGALAGRADTTGANPPKGPRSAAKRAGRRFKQEWALNPALRSAAFSQLASAYYDAYFVGQQRARGLLGYANRHARARAREAAVRAYQTAYRTVIGVRYRILARTAEPTEVFDLSDSDPIILEVKEVKDASQPRPQNGRRP